MRKKIEKVVISDLEAVPKADCFGCLLVDGGDECEKTMETLTGIDCGHGYIFKYAEKWEQCTLENTKVGDEVRHKSRGQKFIVTYMFESGDLFVGKSACNMEDLKDTRHYEINTNR